MVKTTLVRALACFCFAALNSTPVQAQRIDAAVEVVTRFSISDFKVEIVEGISSIGADEKWEVVGACHNIPTMKVEFVTGFTAMGAKLKVEIVQGVSAISADRKICITNASSLDEKTLRMLKLAND